MTEDQVIDRALEQTRSVTVTLLTETGDDPQHRMMVASGVFQVASRLLQTVLGREGTAMFLYRMADSLTVPEK